MAGAVGTGFGRIVGVITPKQNFRPTTVQEVEDHKSATKIARDLPKKVDKLCTRMKALDNKSCDYNKDAGTVVLVNKGFINALTGVMQFDPASGRVDTLSVKNRILDCTSEYEFKRSPDMLQYQGDGYRVTMHDGGSIVVEQSENYNPEKLNT